MKVKIFNWLIIIDILTALLIIFIILIPSSVLRVILGLPFLLFFPGYTLIAALFPLKRVEDNTSTGGPDGELNTSPDNEVKKGIDTLERIALSFGISIAVVALIGLGLNYTPWGIRLLPVLISISIFIAVTSFIAILRQHGSFARVRPLQELHFNLPGWEGSTFNKTLTVILMIAILGAVGTLVYTVAAPKVGERFTEFYILGNDGKAEDYPTLFILKDNQVVGIQYGNTGAISQANWGNVTLGIVNHEQQDVVYSVAVTIDGQPAEIYYAGQTLARLDQIELPQNDKWEQVIGFLPQHAGDNQQVQFLLYKNGDSQPEETLHLWVNATEQ